MHRMEEKIVTPDQIKYIVIHCSATKPNQDIGRLEIDIMHKQRGFDRVGYHVIIRQNGVIEMGRALSEVGAHVSGHNSHSWGVCLVGGLDANGKAHATFSQEQMRSLQMIVEGLKLQAPQAEVLGHRDLSPDKNGDGIITKTEWIKECPCFDTKRWWKQYQ